MLHTFLIDGEPLSAWLSRTASGYELLVDGARYDVAIELDGDGRGMVSVDGRKTPLVMITLGDTAWVHLDGAAHEVLLREPLLHYAGEGSGAADDEIRAPMPGAVIAVHVEAGSIVSANDPLMIIESMKLETVIRAARDGIVELVGFEAGQSFNRDAVLIQLAKKD